MATGPQQPGPGMPLLGTRRLPWRAEGPWLKALLGALSAALLSALIGIAPGVARSAPTAADTAPATPPTACPLTALEPELDLARCLQHGPDTGTGTALRRHLSLTLDWAGPGLLTRVLDLRVPDALALTVTQQSGPTLGASDPTKTTGTQLGMGTGTAPPGPPPAPRLLQDLQAPAPYDQRVLPSPRLAVPLTLAPGRHRIQVDYRIYMDGRLYPLVLDERTWRERNAFKDMASGLALGLLLASLVLALMAWAQAREAATAAYALLVLMHAAGLAAVRGDLFAYVWPAAPQFNAWATLVSVSLVMASHAWFASRFLDLRGRAPTLARWHLGLIALVLVNLAFPPVDDVARRAGGLALVYAVLALWTIVRVQRHGATDHRLYSAGTAAYVVFTLLLFMLCGTGHSPWPGFDHFVFPEIGYLLETSLLSAALFWRLRQARQRQVSAQLQQLADTHALIEADSARRAAEERAEQHNLRLAGAGHDLSQPLAALRLSLAALGPQQDPTGVAAHLDRSIAYAQGLVRELMSQTRQEHEQAGADEPLCLGDCIAQVVHQHGPAAAAKGLRLRGAPCQAVLQASPLVVHRVLHNLVGNAVRYTRRGRILVGVRHRAGGLELQVIDTGPGLSLGALARLQRPFRQGPEPAPEGQGLGLYVVRTLCQEHGLRLQVSSRLGQGSVFAVWIPHAAG